MQTVLPHARTLTALADAVDASRYGHKAAHLASLLRGGFDVPSGFVIPVGLEPVSDDIAQALDVMGQLPVAVRSSSTAEDLPTASFAGQYLSVLNVRGTGGVMAALMQVRESATSARAQRYGGPRVAGMGVIVQAMVMGESSGVAFSANPMTGNRNEVLVSATRGLGEGLVSGEVVADEWVVRGAVARRTAGTQNAIDADMAARVAALAQRVEAHFGAPVDIEWTVRDGRIVLLQARPITVLPVAPEIVVPKGTWQKDMGHFTEPMSPFGAGPFIASVAHALDNVIAEWGMLPDRIVPLVIGHEVYMHADPDDGGKNPPPWWLLGAVARLVPALRKKLKTSQAVLDAGLLESLPATWESEMRPRLQAEIARLAAVDLASLDDQSLGSHVDQVEALCREGINIHFRLFVPNTVGVFELLKVCEELLGMGLAGVMNMLQGLSAASSAPTMELSAVAAAVRRRPDLVAALTRPDAFELLDADSTVGPQLRAWMQRWGLRTIGYDPGYPSYAERPALVIGILAELVTGLSVRDVHSRRTEAVAAARARLSGAALDRFNRALAYAERVFPLREDNVIYTDNLPAGLLRRVGLEMGRRLVAQGRLTFATDMAMLSIEEMRSSADLKALVARRRAEIAWVRTNPGPLYYGPKPGAAPDLRGLPEASRRLNSALIWTMEEELTPPAPVSGDDIGGLAASPGVVTGRVRVIRSAESIEDLQAGEILVCPITTPSWTLVFPRAAALVTDGGSLLSHAAIVAREHGLTAVVATGDASRRLRDGQVVTVDGNRGIVTLTAAPRDAASA